MSTEDKTGEIIELLTELIDLVKALQPKVENHTHHHYPASPTYYYPNQWTTGVTTGGYINPGTTTTWSTNDPPHDGSDFPPE
jgi:hypothetical protein